MDSTHVSSNVRDHGEVVDELKKRVQCNYCSKVVSGFSRFKEHLGGVRGDVKSCPKVHEDVKIHMRNNLPERKSNTSWNKNSPTNSTKFNYSDLESSQSPMSGKRKCTLQDPMQKRCPTGKSILYQKTIYLENAAMSEEARKDSIEHVQNGIGRFFCENGIDSSAVVSPSFREMLKAVIECGYSRLRVPNSNELQGWILQEELENIHNYVKEVKESWKSTGCSILLDGWTDEKGRNLLNFIVDCPKGAIYLRSADISASMEDVDALIALLDGVIEEVGVENVIQVMTYNKSKFMVDVGKKLEEKHKSLFWTVCASHCISFMVQKITMMDAIKSVLSKSKTIVEFISSHPKLWKFLRMHVSVLDLVNLSGVRSMIPFLELNNIVAKEENLKNVVGALASTLSSTYDGKCLADLVEDPSFWSEGRVVLKVIIPLVHALDLISRKDDTAQMGYIYETMDQAKETIKNEFKNKKTMYMPFWEIIDDIWNNQLHSPLHAAGYILNPSLFYCPYFFSSARVASGLLSCILRMTEHKETQDLIKLQLNEYREAKGAFQNAAAIAQRTKLPPAKWWSLYGGQCPELQKFAIRILCQTCSGTLKYDLNRNLSGELHTNGRHIIERDQLNDRTFFRLNLQLWFSLSDGKKDGHIVFEGIEPVDGQAPDQHVDPGDDFIELMLSDKGFINWEGPSCFQPNDIAELKSGTVEWNRSEHSQENGCSRKRLICTIIGGNEAPQMKS